MIRSGQQQMNDEVGMMYKRLTDPEEIERARMQEQEQTYVQSIADDAGVSYNKPNEDSC
jgi:hypothetical protein